MGVAVRVLPALAVVALWLGIAHAQPGPSTSEVLREANAAALAGDWPQVSRLVDPLFGHQLAFADLGEAHRLAGIAAFFERVEDAEAHFVAYLRINLDGRLDPALYPPEVVAYFNDVARRHSAELGPLRVKPFRSWLLTLVPPIGQLQNGDRTKAYVLGGVLGALLVTNLTTYYYLRAWCEHTDGKAGGGLSCYDGGADNHDRNHDAARLRPYNIASGISFLVVYALGVYDGVRGYRQRSREQQALQPFVTVDASPGNRVLGVAGSF